MTDSSRLFEQNSRQQSWLLGSARCAAQMFVLARLLPRQLAAACGLDVANCPLRPQLLVGGEPTPRREFGKCQTAAAFVEKKDNAFNKLPSLLASCAPLFLLSFRPIDLRKEKKKNTKRLAILPRLYPDKTKPV